MIGLILFASHFFCLFIIAQKINFLLGLETHTKYMEIKFWDFNLYEQIYNWRIDICWESSNLYEQISAVYFEACQTREHLKQLFTASSLDAGAAIDIKSGECSRACLRKGLQTSVSHPNYPKQAEKFEGGTTISNGIHTCICDTHTPCQVERL
jgi:hypothetical protein